MLTPAFRVCRGSRVSSAVGGSSDIRVVFPILKDFIRDDGASHNLQRFAAMSMNGESTSIRDVRFWRDLPIALGTWQKIWWNWEGHGASGSCFVTAGVENPLIRSLTSKYYKKRLGQPAVAMLEMVLSKLQVKPEVIKPPGGSSRFSCWLMGILGAQSRFWLLQTYCGLKLFRW